MKLDAPHPHGVLAGLGRSIERDEQFTSRFEREARAAAGLNHPNVVRVFDVDFDGALAELILRCASKEPELRPRDAQELTRLLEPFSGGRVGRVAAPLSVREDWGE